MVSSPGISCPNVNLLYKHEMGRLTLTSLLFLRKPLMLNHQSSVSKDLKLESFHLLIGNDPWRDEFCNIQDLGLISLFTGSSITGV